MQRDAIALAVQHDGAKTMRADGMPRLQKPAAVQIHAGDPMLVEFKDIRLT